MSHKSRSIANTRFEARRIYHQRRIIRNLEQENKKQKEVINKTIEIIEEFICTIEYIQVDGIAIAENYEKILNMLKEVSK